jgi:hypothetical protein
MTAMQEPGEVVTRHYTHARIDCLITSVCPEMLDAPYIKSPHVHPTRGA